MVGSILGGIGGLLGGIGSAAAGFMSAKKQGELAKKQQEQIDTQMKNMQEDRNRKLAQEKLAQDNIDNGLNAGIATAQQNMMNQKRKKMPGLNEMSAFTGGNNNGVV